jgi:hypothetical protein
MKTLMARITLLSMLSMLVACGGVEFEDPTQGAGDQNGKADYWFEDNEEGDGCYWNWQCDSEAELVCRPKYNYEAEVVSRACKSRAGYRESCDEDTDCADGGHRCVTTPYTRFCMPVDEDHPECAEDQMWCEGDMLKICLLGRYRDHDCMAMEGKVCRDNQVLFGMLVSACVQP